MDAANRPEQRHSTVAVLLRLGPVTNPVRRLAVCLLVALAACGGTVGGEAGAPDLSMAKAAAIEYALGASDLGAKELVYVVGPSLETWDQWCGFDTGEPGEDPHDEILACNVLDETSFDLPVMYETGSESATEIEEALKPAAVEFIEDPQSVIEPFEEGMMIAPIRNDAGLLTIGVLLEEGGLVYVAMDAHGEGWLLELTPDGGGGWQVRPMSQYIV